MPSSPASIEEEKAIFKVCPEHLRWFLAAVVAVLVSSKCPNVWSPNYAQPERRVHKRDYTICHLYFLIGELSISRLKRVLWNHYYPHLLLTCTLTSLRGRRCPPSPDNRNPDLGTWMKLSPSYTNGIEKITELFNSRVPQIQFYDTYVLFKEDGSTKVTICKRLTRRELYLNFDFQSPSGT